VTGSERLDPLLCVVHDDRGIRELLVGDLAERFGGHYDIEAFPDAETALAALRRYADDARPVAAVLSADSDVCGGETFRVDVHDLHRQAQRVVLIGRGEWSRTHPAVSALRSGQAESYIFVPWVQRERWLYLPVTEILAEWEMTQKSSIEVVQLIGREWEPRTHALPPRSAGPAPRFLRAGVCRGSPHPRRGRP
jgi:thioredoxin reductase (NADPH)